MNASVACSGRSTSTWRTSPSPRRLRLQTTLTMHVPKAPRAVNHVHVWLLILTVSRGTRGRKHSVRRPSIWRAGLCEGCLCQMQASRAARTHQTPPASPHGPQTPHHGRGNLRQPPSRTRRRFHANATIHPMSTAVKPRASPRTTGVEARCEHTQIDQLCAEFRRLFHSASPPRLGGYRAAHPSPSTPSAT